MAKYLDMPGLTYFYNQIKSKFASKTDVGTPLKANTVSDMSDPNKIYIYTGSEDGYTTGHWYYKDSGSWIDGGAYNSVALETDESLSLADMPADAKAVGDETANLKNVIKSILKTTGLERDLSSSVLFTDNYRINYQTGKSQYYENYDASSSSFIDVSVYDSISVTVRTQSSNGVDGIAFYDADKNRIDGEKSLNDRIGGNIETKTLTVPSVAKYLRVTWLVSTASNFSSFSCIGRVAGELNSFLQELSTSVDDISDLQNTTGVVKDISSAFEFTNNGRINYNTGELQTYDNYDSSASNFVSVAGFDRIFITMRTMGANGVDGLAFYDESKTYIPGSGVVNLNTWTSGNIYTSELRIPDGCSYIRTTWLGTSNDKYSDFSCICISDKAYTKDVLEINGIANVSGSRKDISNLFTFYDEYRINYQTGAAQYYNDYDSSATNFVDVSEYDSVIISTSTQATGGADGIAFYDNEQEYTSGIRDLNDTVGGNAFIQEVQIPPGTKYIRATWVGSGNVNYDNFSCYGCKSGDISNIVKGLSKFVSDFNIPEYYFDENYLDNKVQSINNIATTLDRNSGRAIFFTDYHLETNTRKSPMLINYIINKTGIKTVVFGGDAYNKSSVSSTEGFNLLCEFLEDVNQLNESANLFMITGNHEMNDPSASDINVRLSPEAVYQVFNEPNNKLITCIDDSNSFYYDDTATKIRYYFIDCDYASKITVDTRINIFESLLDVPEGYSVFLFSHIGTTQTNDVVTGINSRFEQIMQCCAAMNDGVSVTISIGGNKTYNFTGKQRRFIGAITGHLHLDGYVVYDDRFPVISTNSDRINGVRRSGTITEQAFDVVQIDVTNKRIYCTRIGYGEDRVFSFGEAGAGLITV